MRITRIAPLSAAKVVGITYAILGLIFGALMSLMALVGGGMMGDNGGAFGAIMGVGAVILMPILYGVAGFIGTLITVFFMNMGLKYAGGLDIDTA